MRRIGGWATAIERREVTRVYAAPLGAPAQEPVEIEAPIAAILKTGRK